MWFSTGDEVFLLTVSIDLHEMRILVLKCSPCVYYYALWMLCKHLMIKKLSLIIKIVLMFFT